jgi:hypothetical protein
MNVPVTRSRSAGVSRPTLGNGEGQGRIDVKTK